MPAVHLEIEKKYAAGDAFELPPLLELVSSADGGSPTVDPGTPLAEGETARQQLAAVYFDTADLRLAAAGLALRRRRGGEDAGWHLKVPAGAGARSEVRLPLGRGARTVPPQLLNMVWAHTLGEPLEPVAEISTDRTVRRLVDATGQVLAEVADDRVTARRLLPMDGVGDAAGATTTWRELEVELVGGTAELMDAVDTRLKAAGLREAGSSSKLAHVLGTGTKPAAGTTVKLTPKSAAGQVVLTHVRGQVQAIRTQDLPVRLDAPDSIHKMRVATRRLRSALTTFKPLFAKEVVRPLRAELTWLAGELGAARDAEVMRDRVAEAVAAEVVAPEAGAVAAGLAGVAAEIDAELGAAYREAHDRVLAELDGERYHRLLTDLDGLVAAPPFTERADDAARKALPRLVAGSYTVVRRLVEEAAARPDDAEREELLHDARKAAKVARYAGESVERVFGRDAARFARAMEAVQEALGEHQDSVLTRERLHELGTHTSSVGAAFLYGRLHALEEARAAQSHQHVDRAWKAAGRTSVHRWLR